MTNVLIVQDSEAAGEQSFAEFKRQRRAEQDDVEFPDEVLLHAHYTCIMLSLLFGCSVYCSRGTTMAILLWTSNVQHVLPFSASCDVHQVLCAKPIHLEVTDVMVSRGQSSVCSLCPLDCTK